MVTSLRTAALGLTFTVGDSGGRRRPGSPGSRTFNSPILADTRGARARHRAGGAVGGDLQRLGAAPGCNAARNSPNRVVVTDVQAVGVDKTSERLAVVTTYQYEGNLTINRLVDLNSGRVVEEDRMQNGGARFTNVEQQYARELLMGDERVRRLVEPLQGREQFNFLLTTTPDPNNPLYGKRVVNVLISTPEGYLTEVPRISINLTDAAVVVGPTP